MIHDSILDTIGNTPMVRINKIANELPCQVFAKVEYFNPGHSTKDRMALQMVEDAEKEGRIKPGGTFIECTSGNTGMGIALAAVVKGYKTIFTTSDKQSKEKVDVLRALGAEVIVCPTNVEPDDPRSYYSVAERLSKQIPNSCWLNQYDNMSNTKAHYQTTGPEIWEQTNGKITHFIVGVGTGGTISGIGKYLKEQNPDVKIWGVDSYGSVFKKYHETGIFDEKEIYPYILEGIGEDILPANVNFDIIDYFEKVTDKDAAVMTRRLAREEGLLLGYSCGAAMQGLLQLKDKLGEDDVVVVLFHDHGSRYVGKVFNDDWMRDRGYLDGRLQVSHLVRAKQDQRFLSVSKDQKVKEVLEIMKNEDISQLPIMDGDAIVGSVNQNTLLEYILASPLQNTYHSVSNIMGDPFPSVDMGMNAYDLNKYISKYNEAVIVTDNLGEKHILTQYDLLRCI